MLRAAVGAIEVAPFRSGPRPYGVSSGGSSGVPFLKKALDIEFFPELLRVRTELGA